MPGCDLNLGGVSKDQTRHAGWGSHGEKPPLLGPQKRHLGYPRVCTQLHPCFAIRHHPGRTHPYPEWTEPGVGHGVGVLKGEASVALTAKHIFSNKTGKTEIRSYPSRKFSRLSRLHGVVCKRGPLKLSGSQTFFFPANFFLLQMNFIYRPTI